MSRSPLVCATVALAIGAAAYPAVGDGPCLEHRISIDEPCVGPECWYTAIGATEANGVRHVVWRQNDPAPRVRTARVGGDGVVVVGEIAFDAGPSSVHSLAVRGDLLAVGVESRIEVFRLVASDSGGAWIHEASLSDGTAAPIGRRIAIALGPVERVIGSATSVNTVPPGGPVGSPVRIFRNDGEWTLEQVIPVPPPNSGSEVFGADFAIDGSTLAVGRPRLASPLSLGANGIDIYDLVDGIWTPTQVVAGPELAMPGAGHRLALVGDTMVATVAHSNPWAFNGWTFPIDLQVYRRGAAGFEPSDYIFGSTAMRRGWELDAHESEGDMLLYGSIYRQLPVISGAFRFRIRDGVVIEELALPVPSSDLEGMQTPIWGIAAVDGPEPWVAVTAPTDPAGASVSIIGLAVTEASCPQPTLGDLNGDGIVDGADLGLLLAQWGLCIGCPGDLNGDGVVDGADLGILLDNWTIDGEVRR